MPRPTRRDLLKITAGAAAGVQASGAPSGQAKPQFFTPEEFRLVDELTEMILPADDRSPGARGAECAAYLDRRLAEAFEAETKQQWKDGLKRIEALARKMHGKRFLEAAPAERVAVLTAMAANEKSPKTPEEQFFAELKARTVNAYYTSKIGIHTELKYQGNKYQEEYAGYDANYQGEL
jgi:hypothetical protein